MENLLGINFKINLVRGEESRVDQMKRFSCHTVETAASQEPTNSGAEVSSKEYRTESLCPELSHSRVILCRLPR